MNRLNGSQRMYPLMLVISLAALIGCVPMHTVSRPTLDDVRLGKAAGAPAEDLALRPDEVRAEVLQVELERNRIRVWTDGGRREVLPYDINRTRVTYHGWDYTVASLESGDVIAFRVPPRGSYVDMIRIQEPVQARAGGAALARRTPPPRADVIEGTVNRVQHDLGVFDVTPRAGRPVTVAVPFNAKPADVENFRRLRRGDYVRVEGEFTNPESFQLLSFLSPRGR